MIKGLTISLPIILITAVLSGCGDKSEDNRASDFSERSQAYIQQGQFRAALIELRNAIQAAPGNQVHLNNYARLLIEIGSPRQAEELLEQIEAPDDAIRLTLLDALLKQGKFISASTQVEQLNKNAHDSIEFDRLSALQAYLSGDRQKAMNSFRDIASQPDATIDVKIQFVELLIQNRQLSEANDWLSQLLPENPENAELLYLRAVMAYENEDLAASEAYLTDALFFLQETDILLNERLQVLELLSNVLTRQGRPDEALIYSKIIKEASPEAFMAKQQYKDALAAAGAGDLVTAKSTFEDILYQFPNNQQAALLLGLIHLEEGDVAAGEVLLTENLDAETAPVSIIQATALAQAEQGKSDQARTVLEKALLARPDDTSLLSLYGIISLNSGQPQNGLKAISKALELDPSLTRLRLLLGQYYNENSQPQVALGHLRQAYRTNPEDWSTTSYLLTSLINDQQIAEANEIIETIDKQYADVTEARWLTAAADYQTNNIPGSIQRLEALHADEPENENVIKALARIYQSTQSEDKAIDMWLKALELNPGNTGVLTSIVGALLRETGQVSVSSELIDMAKTHPEASLPLHSAAVELLVNNNRLSEAQTLATDYAENGHPMAKSIRANLLRGQALQAIEQEDWSKATQFTDQALAELPGNSGLIRLKSKLLQRQGRSEDALTVLNQAISIDDSDMSLVAEKTRLIATVESNDAAFDYLDSVWQKSPTGELAGLFFSLLQSAAPERMEIEMQRLQSKEPKNTVALTGLAGLKLQQGDNAGAIQYYEQAIAVNDRHVVALNNLAWLKRVDDIESSLMYAQKASELAPESASVLDTYGWILHLSGQPEKALEVINRALELEPDNAEILEHRATIQNS